MDFTTSVRYSEKLGRQRHKDHHGGFPKKIYLRVIVPAPKEHIKYSGNYTSYRSSKTPRRYTMVAKEMSFELGKITRNDTYGEIRLAHSTTCSKTIVVKCIHKDHPQIQNYVKYILPREIALLKMLKGHPNVVSFIGVMEADHYAMVAMEHIEGMSLMEYISKNHVIREEEARLIFSELLNTVITCHSMGISIRSLACHNVLLDKSLIPKVSTLEHAIVRGYDKVDIFEGTCYSPPEIFEGSEYDSKLVDVWSLGIILYTMVTGTEPCFLRNFDSSKPFSLTFPQYLSYQCHTIIKRMLHPSPQSRISVSELKRDEWLNDAMLKSVEYKLENNSDTDLDDGNGQSLLSSSELKLMYACHSCAQHSAPLVECDLCKSSFNMRNSGKVDSFETASQGGIGEERMAVGDYEDKEAVSRVSSSPRVLRQMISHSRSDKDCGSSGGIPSVYAMPKSFSAGTLSSVTNKILKSDKENRISIVGSSKSVNSVPVAPECSGERMPNTNSIPGVPYSEIQHFLSEELKQLAETTKALNEEKRFLDLFDQCVPASDAGSVEPWDDSDSARCLLNKSTSCINKSLVDQSTSYSVHSASTDRTFCDTGVETVIERTDQHVQCARSRIAETSKDLSTVSSQVSSVDKDSGKSSDVAALPSDQTSTFLYGENLATDGPAHVKLVNPPVASNPVANVNQQCGHMSQASKSTELSSTMPPGGLNADRASSTLPMVKDSFVNGLRDGVDTSTDSDQKKGSMLRRLISWGYKRSSSHSQTSSANSRGKKSLESQLSSSSPDSYNTNTTTTGSEVFSRGVSQNKARQQKKQKGKDAGQHNTEPPMKTGRKKDSFDSSSSKFWSSKRKRLPAKSIGTTRSQAAADSQ